MAKITITASQKDDLVRQVVSGQLTTSQAASRYGVPEAFITKWANDAGGIAPAAPATTPAPIQQPTGTPGPQASKGLLGSNLGLVVAAGLVVGGILLATYYLGRGDTEGLPAALPDTADNGGNDSANGAGDDTSNDEPDSDPGTDEPAPPADNPEPDDPPPADDVPGTDEPAPPANNPGPDDPPPADDTPGTDNSASGSTTGADGIPEVTGARVKVFADKYVTKTVRFSNSKYQGMSLSRTLFATREQLSRGVVVFNIFDSKGEFTQGFVADRTRFGEVILQLNGGQQIEITAKVGVYISSVGNANITYDVKSIKVK